jgi:hypothetical protein
MSGLEIAVGVAGIISALVQAAKGIYSIRDKRKKNKLAASLNTNTDNAESRLITTLNDGKAEVKSEYDNDVRRIGPSFEHGDGIPPRSFARTSSLQGHALSF